MITVIVVVCLVVLLIVAITCFVFGWKTGRAKIEHEIAQDAARKEADKKYYESEKAKIKAEVFKDADTKKKKMSNSSWRDKLMLSITACATSPKIEYVFETHDIIFPQFPDPEPVAFDDTTETVVCRCGIAGTKIKTVYKNSGLVLYSVVHGRYL